MAYTTSAAARNYVDWREMADLASRNDAARMALATFDVDPVWTAALLSGSGQLTSAIGMGGRYTAAAVLALTGEPAGLRDRIVTALAVKAMIEGRPDKNLPVPAEHHFAEQQLFFLRNGELIFG